MSYQETVPNYLKGMMAVVTDTGQLYSSYEEMARILKLTKWQQDRDNWCKNGDKVKIIGVSRHEDDPSEIIVGIEYDDKRQFIMSLKGIEVDIEEDEAVPKTEFFNAENLVF